MLCEEQDDVEEDKNEDGEDVQVGDNRVMELPQNSVVALNKPKILKIKGSIHEESVTVLIDCEATQFDFFDGGK